MDGETFDNLVKRLTQTRLSRLDALRGAAASALVGLAGVTLSDAEGEAKPHHRTRKGKGKGKGRKKHAKKDTRKHKAQGTGKKQGKGKHKVNASAKPACGKEGADCSGDQPPCCKNLICPDGTCRKTSPSGGCVPGQIKCNGVCINMDNTNCGACGVACQSGQSCENGICTSTTTTTPEVTTTTPEVTTTTTPEVTTTTPEVTTTTPPPDPSVCSPAESCDPLAEVNCPTNSSCAQVQRVSAAGGCTCIERTCPVPTQTCVQDSDCDPGTICVSDPGCCPPVPPSASWCAVPCDTVTAAMRATMSGGRKRRDQLNKSGRYRSAAPRRGRR